MTAMRCRSCDHDNRAERRFCAECGTSLAAPCASCGTTNEPTADRVIAETGACSMTPFLHVERVALAGLRGDDRQQLECLRQAHAGLTRMGATGRARATAAALGRLGNA